MEPTAAIEKPRQGRSNEEQYQDMHRRISEQRKQLDRLNRVIVDWNDRRNRQVNAARDNLRKRIAYDLRSNGYPEMADRVMLGERFFMRDENGRPV